MFNAEIQDGRQKWQENNFCEKPSIDSADTLWVKNFDEIAVSRSVSQMNVFYAEIQKWGENVCCEKSPVDCAYTLQVKGFVKITLSLSVSEINVFLCFTQKFKTAAKSGLKTIFGKSCQLTLRIPWGSNFFVKIALSHSISEINMQKFKMAAKSGRKMFVAKGRQ